MPLKISQMTVGTPAGSSILPFVKAGANIRATVKELFDTRSPLFVDDYGAKGDGVTDDSAKLALACAAINAAGGGVLSFRPGATYMVGGQTVQNPPIASYFTWYPNAPYPLEFANCTKPVVLRGNGAVIRCLPNAKYGVFNTDGTPKIVSPGYVGVGASTPYYGMVYAHGCVGVHMEDLELDGNLNSLNVNGYFSDTGIQIQATGMFFQNNNGPVTCSNVYTHHHGLDGYTIDGPATGATFGKEAGTFTSVRSECNGRQGMSFVGGKGWSFISCTYNWTGRANPNSNTLGKVSSNPCAGIDFEAEGGKEIRDVVLDNCEMVGNYGAGIVSDSGTNTDRILLRKCTIISTGTGQYSIWLNRPGFSLEECLIVGTVNGVSTYHGYGVGSDPFNPYTAVKFYRCRLTNDLSLSPTGTVGHVNNLLVEGGLAYIEFDGCAFINTQAVAAGGGNADQMLYRNCVFISRAGGDLTMSGRFEGPDTHFVEDGGGIGLPNRFFNVVGRNNAGDALDSFFYSTVAANVPTTVRFGATIDRQTRDILGTASYAADTNVTFTPGTDRRIQKLTGVITAGRAVTLATGKMGSKFRIVRTGAGAFNWDIGGLKNLAVGQWCEVEYDSQNFVWTLTSYGVL